jgi:hypothetical protein
VSDPSISASKGSRARDNFECGASETLVKSRTDMSRIDGRQILVGGARFGAQVFKKHGCLTLKYHGTFLHELNALNDV